MIGKETISKYKGRWMNFQFTYLVLLRVNFRISEKEICLNYIYINPNDSATILYSFNDIKIINTNDVFEFG